MLYFGNPSSPAIRAAMTAGRLGCMVTPAQGKMPPPGATWAADNGKFGKGYPGDARYLRWLEKLTPGPLCRFVIVPDAPFDAAATLQLYPRLAPAVRSMGFPRALAGQNGMEHMGVPWDEVEVLCLGGDDSWKTGPGGAELAKQALSRGIPVHLLRGNSYGRLAKAAGIGCISADGTFLAIAPDTNLPRVLAWLDKLDRTWLQGVVV